MSTGNHTPKNIEMYTDSSKMYFQQLQYERLVMAEPIAEVID